MSQMYRPNPQDPLSSQHQYKPPEPPEGPDPKERLDQLKIVLAQQETRLDHIGKQRDELKADIQELETTLQEVQGILQSYGGEIKDLEGKLHELQYFYDLKQKMIMAAIGDKKEPIDDLINAFDRDTDEMRRKLEELGERRGQAGQESEEADKVQEEEQREYDEVKAYKGNTEAKLTDMDGLRAAITSADDANDAASMYFLVLEFHGVLRHTQIWSQYHLAHELKQKLGDLEAAKENARTKKAHWDNLKAEYTAHQATLDARIASRRQHLLNAVKAMFPPHKQAAAQGASTGAGSDQK